MKQEEEYEQPVRFSDLSTALKFLVVCCWILVGFNIFAFVIGFLIGFSGAVY